MNYPIILALNLTKNLRNPRFQAFRAQNRDFCALLGSGTHVFRHFEHKIGIFVRFCPSEPSFSGISSTKSRFLCFFGLRDPHFRAFRAQNQHFCALWWGHGRGDGRELREQREQREQRGRWPGATGTTGATVATGATGTTAGTVLVADILSQRGVI